MNGVLIGKKLWIFVCLVLFVAGCAAGAGDARAPAGPGGSAQQGAYPQSSGFGGESESVSPSSKTYWLPVVFSELLICKLTQSGCTVDF